MKDRAGNELQVGDHVLFLVAGTSNSRLEWGVIESFTEKMVRIYPDNNPMRRHTEIRQPRSVIKPFRESCVYDCSYCHANED